MVGRRLVALLVVLLVIGAVAAAIAPQPGPGPLPATTAPTTTAAAPPDRSPARTVTLSLPAGSTPDDVVRARSGDLVRLTVAAAAPGTVTIDGLDRLEPVDPDTPARFEFIADRTGTFPVRLALSSQGAAEAPPAVGRLEIAPAA
ncbi:MAG: hypothetical protein U0R70_16285 [Solirubrobacteraceae bacterium]